MDVRVELLSDDAWAAEYDKTGLLIVRVDGFDQLYLKVWPIYFPMMQISTEKRKYDKWG